MAAEYFGSDRVVSARCWSGIAGLIEHAADLADQRHRRRRRSLARTARSWDRLACALFFVAALLVIATFTDYGVTWDEDAINWYGVFVLQLLPLRLPRSARLHWLDLYQLRRASST